MNSTTAELNYENTPALPNDFVGSLIKSAVSGCLALIILSPRISSAAEAFEVTGTVRNKAYLRDGSEMTYQTNRFVAAVNGAKWHIREIYTDTHWVEYGCDGTNIFQVLHDLSTPKKAASRMRPGLVLPGTYPVVASWAAALAWLEYCSAARLSSQEPGERVLAPWLSPISDAHTYALKAHLQLSEGEPRVPATVRFVTDADRLKTAFEGQWLSSASMRMARQHEDELFRNLAVGRSAGEVEVLSWTNVGTLLLPRSFKATRRALGDLGRPGGWIFEEYHAEAEKIVIAPPRESYLPDISGVEVAVGDFRLRDRSVRLDNIRYQITNGVWTVNLNESRRAEFERLKRTFSRSYRQPSVDRKVVLMLLLITLLAPFLFVVWKRTRKATAAT